jgi:radical SAM protein with 4Fe4S-binding SPASM domain
MYTLKLSDTKEAMMPGQYVIPSKNLWCWRSPENYSIFYENSSKSYTTNEDGMIILKTCNGKRTLDEVITVLKERKPLTDEDVGRIKDFIGKLVDANIAGYSPTPAEQVADIRVVGEDTVYKPIHCTLELTDACNLRCVYCYRDSGPQRDTFLKDPIGFLTKIHDQGIRVVELSGGEPLMHPQFEEILNFAIEKFFHIALLSNGVLLNERILDTIEKNNMKATLQVSVPSMKKERFAKITGLDAWERLHKNLMLLKDRDIKFRIGMVFHDDAAVEELRDSAFFAKSLGALQFVCTPFINLGRAQEISISPDAVLALNSAIQELQKELPPRFLGIVESDFLNPAGTAHNCGAGARCVVFAPDEKLRPCPMFPADEFSGLALQDATLREKLTQIVSPNMKVCGECKYLPYCGGCFLRGWIKYKETQCEWGKSQHIDEIFDALRSNGSN